MIEIYYKHKINMKPNHLNPKNFVNPRDFVAIHKGHGQISVFHHESAGWRTEETRRENSQRKWTPS